MRIHAKKAEEDGIIFDSMHERNVYRDLKLRQRAGEIHGLKVHEVFRFFVNGVLVCTMKPDFVYFDKQDTQHVADAKGFKRSKKTGKLLPRVNREFYVKKNLMKACYGLEIEIL